MDQSPGDGIEGISVELVLNGEILRNNLPQVNLTEEMLMVRLQAQG